MYIGIYDYNFYFYIMRECNNKVMYGYRRQCARLLLETCLNKKVTLHPPGTLKYLTGNTFHMFYFFKVCQIFSKAIALEYKKQNAINYALQNNNKK